MDRNAIPTKAWLRANAPRGSYPAECNQKWFHIPINDKGWTLTVTGGRDGTRGLHLVCVVYWHPQKPINFLDLGKIRTAGELIDWYERLSGKAWLDAQETNDEGPSRQT